MSVTLDLTTDQFDTIHHQIDRTRRNKRLVAVDREALMTLLVDHSRALKALKAVHVQIVGDC